MTGGERKWSNPSMRSLKGWVCGMQEPPSQDKDDPVVVAARALLANILSINIYTSKVQLMVDRDDFLALITAAGSTELIEMENRVSRGRVR